MVNDNATPGNNYFYGTGPTGTKGFFLLSSAGVTSLTGTAGQITVSASIGAITLSLPSALTGINSITSVAGQNLVLATGTTGTAATFTSATNALTLSQGALTFTGATTVTGGAGNMTIVSGTGASRTLIFQTTTSGSVATTALTLDATQGGTLVGNLTVSGTGTSSFAATSNVVIGATTTAAANGLTIVNQVNDYTDGLRVVGTDTNYWVHTVAGGTAFWSYNGVADTWKITSAGNATLVGNLTVSGTGASTLGAANSVFTMNGAVASTTTSTGTLIISGAGGLGVGGAINVGTTGTFTGNVTAPDYLLGTSGPSVKSSLGARGPRQGLGFDGIGGADFSGISALGTTAGTISMWVNCTNTSGSSFLTTNAAGSYYLRLNGTTPTFTTDGGAVTGPAITAGKWHLITTVINGNGTAVVYTDGIAGTSGPITANLSTAFDTIGKYGSPYFTGRLAQPLILNYAKTAAEVLSLFETGVPPVSDYNSASNTAINSGTFINYGGTGTFSGASATGFQIVNTAGVFPSIMSQPYFAVTVGQKIRVVVTQTRNDANTGTKNVQLFTQAGASASAAVALSDGANTVELTATVSGSSIGVLFGHINGAAADITYSGIAITRLGLVLALDELSGGAGSTWAAAPGTSATITLPASGVNWAIPRASIYLGPTAAIASSLTTHATTGALTVTSAASTDLTLAGGSSGASFALGSSTGVGALVTTGNVYGDMKYSLSISDTTGFGQGVGGGILFRGKVNAGGDYGNFAGIQGYKLNATTDNYSGQLHFYTRETSGATTRKAVITETGNLLIGTTTDITGSAGARFSGTTAASTSITGTVIIGNLTTATTVGIGGGKIFTGSDVTVGGNLTIGSTSGGLVLTTGNAGTNLLYSRFTNTGGSSDYGVDSSTGGSFFGGASPAYSLNISAASGRALWLGTGTVAALKLAATTGDATLAGNLTVSGTTEATTISAASVVLSGGLAITKSLVVGGGTGLGVTLVTSAAGTTTLTAASPSVNILTGSTTQTYQLGAANALGAGISIVYSFINRSSGVATIQRAGSDTIEGATTYALSGGNRILLVSDGVSQWSIV